MNDPRRIKKLAEEALEKGARTYADIMDLLPEGFVDPAGLEEVFDSLERERVHLFASAREHAHFTRRKKRRDPAEAVSQDSHKDSVNRFMKMMGKIKPLAAGERRDLVGRMMELVRDPEADPAEISGVQERLVQGHMRLVVSLAKKYTRRGVDFQDLIQEGNRGLLEAVRKYHYRDYGRFVPYVIDGIKERLMDALAHLSGTIGLSRNENRELKKLAGSYGKLEQFVEIIDHDDGKRAERIETAKKIKDRVDIKYVRSLDAPVFDGELGKLSDYIADGAKSQTEHLELGEDNAVLYRHLDRLAGDERQIIILRYGIRSKVYKTWPEIADRLNISVKKAMNLETRALRKLRRLLASGSRPA